MLYDGLDGEFMSKKSPNFSENTVMFPTKDIKTSTLLSTLRAVCQAMKEKGYNPVSQLSGYILTEDPTYITTWKNARFMIQDIDRYDILRELIVSALDI